MNLIDHIPAAALLAEGHLLIAVAIVLFMGTVIWHLATGIHSKIRNIITGVMITGIIAATVYTIRTHEDFKPVHTAKGDIEKLGGTAILLKIQSGTNENGQPIPVSRSSLDEAITSIEKRLVASGNKGFYIEAQGNNGIYLELPGLHQDKIPQIQTLLEQPARLEFKLVHPNSRALADQIAADPRSHVIPGYQLHVLEDIDEDGNTVTENLLLKRRAGLNGSSIIRAQELYGPDEGKLTVELSTAGGQKMYELTKKMRLGVDRLAIVLDGKVLSAPTVQSAIGARFEISGMNSAAEAKNIATALLNPLGQPLRIEEIRTISPEMAQKSPNKR